MNITLWLLAATEKIDPSTIGIGDAQRNPDQAVINILNTVYLWAGIVAVLVIVVAGFYYTTSSGDSAGLTRAKQAIIGSVVGLIVIISAFAITQLVLGRF